MNDQSFERDLRLVLASLAPNEVPRSLHESVAGLDAAAARRGRGVLGRLLPVGEGWFERLGTAAMGAVALMLVIVLGTLVVLYASQSPVSPGSGGGDRALSWQTSVVSLEADGLFIEAGGRVFSPPPNASVTSDEGNQTYRTMEFSWREQSVEMRLNLYFAADATHWWVSEIRTYDGRPRGEWVTYRGPFFRTERGASFEGDLDLGGANERGPAKLRIEDMRLTAFVPGSGPRPFEGCRAVGPVPEDPNEPVVSEGNPDLSEFGVRPGMAAAEAHTRLSRQGICHDFRLSWVWEGTQIARGEGYSQRWCLPPPGKVEDAAYGSEGQVILFVSDPAPRPFDPNTPQSVGC